MSILIKGMEMPKRGHTVTITIVGSGQAYVEYYDCRPHVEETIEYTAVPVPPHGDLIDRKPFVEFIKTHWDSYDQWFVEQLEARPTIIPAEEGET